MALNPGSDMEHDAPLAAAYRAGAHETPPVHLDDAIRAAARREAGAGPRRASRLRAWRVPVSLAAVLVLSVTVVLMVREEGGDRLEPAPPPVAPPVAATPQAAMERAMPEVVPPPVPASPATSTHIPPAPQRSAPSPATGGALSGTASQPLAKAAPETGQQAVSSPAPAAAREDAAAGSRRESDPPRPMMRSVPAPVVADTASESAARPAAAPATAMSAAVPAQRALWQDLLTEPAEKWIQRIVEWRRAGRTADAEALAVEFRRRFPEQRLPDESR